MNNTLLGLILDRKDYKEADVLLTVLCENHGVMTWIAKGANKPTSKYNSLLQPLNMINALVDVKKGISLFKSASLVNNYHHVSEHLETLALASFMLKTIAINAQDDPHLFEFDRVIAYMDLLKTSNRYAIGTHFLMNIASKMGLEMVFDQCVICQATTIAAVSVVAGGFVCQTCKFNIPCEVYDVGFYRKVRCLSKATLSQIEQCGLGFIIEHMKLYVDLLDETINIPKKNWQFLIQI